MMSNGIKLILAILLILCLLHLPYGYYQTIRFIGMLGFALLAFLSYQQNQTVNIEVIIYVALVLLFQPFFKIALGRTIWNIMDVIVGVGLVASLFINKKP